MPTRKCTYGHTYAYHYIFIYIKIFKDRLECYVTYAPKTCRLSRLSKEVQSPSVWISIISTEGIDGKLHTIVIVMTGFQISLLIETCVLSHKATSAWHQDIKQASGKGMSKVASTPMVS